MKKILLVDDDPVVKKLLKSCLNRNKYVLMTASNGVEGFSKVVDDRPDLIILDVLMPQLDGYDFVKELNRRGELKKISVIILTGRDGLQDLFKNEGVEDYFVKPLLTEDILNRVEELIGV